MLLYLDGAELSKRWDSLRDKYRKAKKRQEEAERSGAAGARPPTWKFWSEMTWLDDHMKKTRKYTTKV